MHRARDFGMENNQIPGDGVLTGYGRIEDLFRGGQMISPVGKIDLPPFPASAAGPDLRHAMLGSEGRFGVLSRATVKVTPIPEFEGFFGVFFKRWEDGIAAVRGIAQKRVQVSMLRLSDTVETQTTLILSGKERLIRLASFGLEAVGYRGQRCLLIFGVTGDDRTTSQARKSAIGICRQHGGLYTGGYIGKSWAKSRFISPYLRNSLWDAGYALDTLETAVSWEDVSSTRQGIIAAITQIGRQRDLPILVFGHLSHIYQTGASIYITYLFRRSRFPQDNLSHWKAIKGAASQAILEHGGTISHQHGVGSDHADYLPNEKGTLGMNFLREAGRFFDPDGIMNPAVLLNPTQRIPEISENEHSNK